MPDGVRTRRHSVASFFVLLCLGLTPVSAQPVAGNAANDVRALHVRFSIDGGTDFVFVEPAGSGVRLRFVRVASISQYCLITLVQAEEIVVADTTVAHLVRVPACALTSEDVEKALRDARSNASMTDFFGGVAVVAAECADEVKEFVFDVPPLVDHDLLQRQAPDVKALWDLGRRLRSRILASDASDPLSGAAPEAQAAREALGTTLVPELLAGWYGEYLHDDLANYRGPPAVRDASWVEIVDRETLNLAEYVEPVMPPVAKAARLAGDVRLRVAVDARSGVVTNAQLQPANPLLAEAALSAVLKWRFAYSAGPSRLVDVTVRFRQRCP